MTRSSSHRTLARSSVAFAALLSGLWPGLFGCGGDSPSAASGQALPGQSEFEKAQLERQQLLAEAQARQAAEKEKRRAEVEGVGSIKLVKMKAHKSGASAGFDMEVEFKNGSDKELAQAEGRLEFYDGKGELLKMAKMPIRDSVAPGKSVRKKGKFPLSPTSKGDLALSEMKASQVVLKWVPLYYRFADGSTLEGVQ